MSETGNSENRAAGVETGGSDAAGTGNTDNSAARLEFLKSYDFMKLGQAVNHRNWQVAAMTVQRMQNRVRELQLDTFERQLMGIRQCILHKNDKQAKDMLALVMAKRAQLLKAEKSLSSHPSNACRAERN